MRREDGVWSTGVMEMEAEGQMRDKTGSGFWILASELFC